MEMIIEKSSGAKNSHGGAKRISIWGALLTFALVLSTIAILIVGINYLLDNKKSGEYELVKGQLLEIDVKEGMVLSHFNADVPLDVYVSGKLVCKKWVPGQSLQLPPGSQNCDMAFLPYENGTLTHQTAKNK